MRKTMFAAAATALLFGFAGEASAQTAIPLVAGPGDTGQVQLIREGCGFGGHRGFYGGCRGNRGWRGDIYRARRGFYGRGYGYYHRRGFYY